jgi:transporter family protein
MLRRPAITATIGNGSQDMRIDWRVFALGSALFAAFTAIFAKLGVADIDSNLATFYRTIVILAVSALLVSVRAEWRWPIDVSARGILFLTLSGVATGLSWLCYFRALQQAPASRVAPLDKLSVVFVIVLSMWLLAEHPSWKVLVGAALITGGVILTAL